MAGGLSIRKDKTDEGVLGPVAVVAGGRVRLREEGAVAALDGFEEGDMRVRDDLVASIGGETDEGIVERIQNECRDGDLVDDARGSYPIVVILCSSEAGIESDDALVEVAQRADSDGAVGIECAREECCLAAITAQHGTDKFHLVDAVLWEVKGGGRGCEVNDRRDADDGMELWGRRFSEIACELEDKVATHGVADERDGLQMVQVVEEAHDGEHIAGEAGVIEGRRERFRVGAVAHVHTDDVAASRPEFVGVADDVLRVGGAFESVHDDGSGAGGADAFWLPVAVAEHLAGDLMFGRGGDFDELSFSRGEAVRAREVVAEDGLQVSVAHETSRGEVSRLSGADFESG